VEPAGEPAFAFVEVMTFPASSTPTQRVVEGHDTSLMSLAVPTFFPFHATDPPVGFVEVNTFPWVLETTQNVVVRHEPWFRGRNVPTPTGAL
jgi:hypothetical protein